MPGSPPDRPSPRSVPALPRSVLAARQAAYPLGAGVALGSLAADPHPVLAALRRTEPVSWLPALNGWLVTRWDLAVAVLHDSEAFTVDDPRFTTARVVGPSMLSLDGAEHARHRAPFAVSFSRAEVRRRVGEFVADESERLVRELAPAGAADLRSGLARPLAAGVIAWALGLGESAPGELLGWYGAIVAAVSGLAGAEAAGPLDEPGAAGSRAFAALSAALRAVIHAGSGSLLAEVAVGEPGLTEQETISNAAVIAFGAIETAEGMIGNALLLLLSHPDQRRAVQGDPRLVPAAVAESLRLEPAAALVDRYATRDIEVGGAQIRRGDLVSVSLAGAGRDPAVFADPDRFDVRRPNSRLHLAFARGPHFCLGVHLARLEAACAVQAALRLLPGLDLEPGRTPAIGGLVFRKPPSLPARWDPPLNGSGKSTLPWIAAGRDTPSSQRG